jgi:hypothetical protein
VCFVVAVPLKLLHGRSWLSRGIIVITLPSSKYTHMCSKLLPHHCCLLLPPAAAAAAVAAVAAAAV